MTIYLIKILLKYILELKIKIYVKIHFIIPKNINEKKYFKIICKKVTI